MANSRLLPAIIFACVSLTAQTAPIANGKPAYYSVPETEGNYNVTLAIGAPDVACVTTVKAESRRLMIESIATAAGQIVERSITVNVRNSHVPPPPRNAPGGTEVRLNDREQGSLNWDDKLTLEFTGAHPCVQSVSVTRVDDAPTVFLAGDSTVTDQPREPNASWGQMLPRFFAPARASASAFDSPGIAVANHAESGETLKSFLTGLRLDKLLSQMKKGDYLFIQFGHNDEKEQWPQTYVEAMSTYKQYLRAYIGEAKRRGAQPVLITPVERRNFDANGKIVASHRDYPEAVRQVAREDGVPLIDLTAMSVKLYEALGPARSPLAFANNGADQTHHSAYGAYELARCVVEGIRAAHLDLAARLAPDATPFDPAHPDDPAKFAVAASQPAPRTPRLYLIGDSTVRNGAGESKALALDVAGDGSNLQWGWGDRIARFFDPTKLTVVNRARGGRSSRTFITEGLWDDVRGLLQPGDFVMMQFGHNDSSPLDDAARARGTLPGLGEETREIDNPITKQHEVVHTYGWYMRRFIDETRARGATPIMCTLIPRMNWKDGHIARNKSDYAGWAEKLATTAGIPLIDLNELIARKYDEMGPEVVAPLFPADHTHTDLAGAQINAACVIKGLVALPANPLAVYFSAHAAETQVCDTEPQP